MKRSEMLAIINRAKTQAASSDVILHAIEKAGMLPPSFHLPATDEYCTADEIVSYADLDGSFSWEPEDA